MPSRGTTKRNIRISDELWDRAMEGTAAEGTNVSAVVNEFLRQRYIEQRSEELEADLAESEAHMRAVPAQQESPAVIEALGISSNLTRAQKLNALRNRLGGIDNPIERFAIEKQIELLEMLG
jgi:hypothetical protein